IDLVGGSPQGRAWVAGTGEVAVDILLGSDPNTENYWGTSEYDPAALVAEGYSYTGDILGFIGGLRDGLLAGATLAIKFVQRGATSMDDLSPVQMPGAGDASAALELDVIVVPDHKVGVSNWDGDSICEITDIINVGAGAN